MEKTHATTLVLCAACFGCAGNASTGDPVAESGAELSNGQRRTTLTELSSDIAELDKQLTEEHDCCRLMQATIKKMQQRLSALKHTAGQLENEGDPASPDEGGSLGRW